MRYVKPRPSPQISFLLSQLADVLLRKIGKGGDEDGTCAPGTKYYKCYHWRGTSRTHKVTKSVKYSTGRMSRMSMILLPP